MVLAHSVLFQGISKEDLEPLMASGSIVTADPDDYLAKEAEGSTPGFFVILSGGVEVLKRGVPVTQIGRGSFFGEISFTGLTLAPTASIRSTSQSRFFMVTRAKLEEWFKTRQKAEVLFFRHLATQLCQRLFSTTERLSVW